MSRLVLDAGEFVAFERGDAAVRARLAAARKLGLEVATSSPVVGQVWRDGRRQALLTRLVPAVHVVAPDVAAARRAGELLAKTKSADVVDALVVGLLRETDIILTSAPKDFRSLLAAARVRATIVKV